MPDEPLSFDDGLAQVVAIMARMSGEDVNRLFKFFRTWDQGITDEAVAQTMARYGLTRRAPGS
jgi:hypothetical protein